MPSNITFNDCLHGTIIVCTYNRANELEKTLESFVSLNEPPNAETELLIIDNNSTDKTKEVADKYVFQNNRIRYLFESSPGLSHARNTGILASNGDIIAFVDDDIFFDPDWLKHLYEIFLRKPDIVSIGGKVLPYFETEQPKWLSVDKLWIYGVTSYGEMEKIISPPDIPIGCNMAFRKNIFDKIGLFDVSLGRIGKNLLSGEENAIFAKIHELGEKVLYSPQMLVYHRIPEIRVTRQWILKRFYWHGISEVKMIQFSDYPLSRFGLMKIALNSSINLLKTLFGSSINPKKIYWSLLNFDMTKRINLAVYFGMFKQSLSMMLK